MDYDHRPRAAINKALSQLLRPLFRLLLRSGISYGAFEELAKQTFVDVAVEDFGIGGKPPTISRVSVLTGLTRKDVQRLFLAEPEFAPEDQHNRASRVLTGWVRDADFLTRAGEPRPLAPEGLASFAELVRRYSGDVPARAVLDELLHVGAVVRGQDSLLRMIGRAYVPQKNLAEKLRILGTDVAYLIETIDHNLQYGAVDPWFQRKVAYRSMPADAVPKFRRLGAAQSQALLEKFDRWLAEHDLDNPPDEPGLPRARIGVGIYYFEEWNEPPKARGKKHDK